MMLDTKSTFDALVLKHATTPEQGRRILANRFYRNISGALSGTQEYMAMEKLHELHDETDFELVVVDTAPTRHALDFLDARRLSRFLDHRLFRMIAPSRLVKAVNMAAQTFLRTVSKWSAARGRDAITFFQAFEGMEDSGSGPAGSTSAAAPGRRSCWWRPRGGHGGGGRLLRRPAGERGSRAGLVSTVTRRSCRPDRAGGATAARARPGEVTLGGSTATWPTSRRWPA
jgi:hypothetical protein